MGKKQYHPMIELIVACEIAGKALLKISGGLQERHNQDLQAIESYVEAIDEAGNDVLKALATYTAACEKAGAL